MKTEFLEDQFDLAYPDGVENHWWHLARNRIVYYEIKKLTPHASAVLDVGCGRGIMVKYLRQKGIDCKGVELATTKALTGVASHIHFGTNAIEIPYEERSCYATILLLDVVEHLPNPLNFLQSLATAYPRLSHVILTVPARPELWSNYDDFYGHYRRYTAGMIEVLANQLCWEIVSQTYFFRPLYLPARALAVLQKKRNIRFHAPQGLTIMMHRLISYAMIMDYHIIPASVPGTSVFACFRLSQSPTLQDAPANAEMPRRSISG